MNGWNQLATTDGQEVRACQRKATLRDPLCCRGLRSGDKADPVGMSLRPRHQPIDQLVVYIAGRYLAEADAGTAAVTDFELDQASRSISYFDEGW